MRVTEFNQLPTFDDMTKARLRVGDKFLTGKKIIAQQERKVIGNEITYYEVTHASPDGKDISYRPVYDKLEE